VIEKRYRSQEQLAIVRKKQRDGERIGCCPCNASRPCPCPEFLGLDTCRCAGEQLPARGKR